MTIKPLRPRSYGKLKTISALALRQTAKENKELMKEKDKRQKAKELLQLSKVDHGV